MPGYDPAQPEASPAQAAPLDPSLLERLLTHALAAVAYIDRTYALRWVNPANERLFGRSESARLGLMAAARSDPRLAEVFKTGRTERADDVPLQLTDEVGVRTIYLDISYVPVFGEQGGVDGVLVLAVDVTSRVEADQLRDRYEKLKGDFLTAAAHELRTPLSAVMGNAELLEEAALGPLSDAQRDVVGQLQHGALELKVMVDRLLEIAQIESGRLALSFERQDLAPLVIEAVESYRARAAAKRVELACERPASPLFVRMDPQRIREVLTQLLDNALKYTPQGGRVTVTAALREDRAAVEVRDTGVGITEEVLPHVFERFYQPDPSEHGAGLGLAIAKSLVEIHGGQIGVLSRAGQGATFWFWLPLAEPHPGKGA